MVFDQKGIYKSVKNITDEVLKLSIQKVVGGERPLLRWYSRSFAKTLNLLYSYFNFYKMALRFEAMCCFSMSLVMIDALISSYTSWAIISFWVKLAQTPQIRLQLYNHFKNILYLCGANQFT